ncbi:MAG TPA: hypothetical protein VFW13_07480, partial [Phenylobacterium sp.]|nr:hypothetical protein [Phenylobacterium sp.]
PPAPAAPPSAAPGAAAGKTVSPVVVTPIPQPTFEAKKNTVVCHDEQVLGSMFPKKVCATETQRAERRSEDQEQLRQWTALKPYKSN